MSYRICLECGKEFRKSRLHRKFCCDNCRKLHTRNIRKKTYKTIKCPICNTSFKPKSSTNKYCSKECCIKYQNGLKKRTFVADKICKICGNNFLAKHFNNTCCSEACKKEASNITKRRSYFKYREKMIEKHKVYNNKNKEKLAKYFKQYRKDNLENKHNYEKEYYKKNKKKIINYSIEYKRQKILKCPSLKIRYTLSGQIRHAIKNKKNFKTFKLLGYSAEDLRVHLESQFKDNMSWDNYGMYGWHIDHIRPVSSFRFTKEDGEPDLEQIKLCWDLDNLQPLWHTDNASKGSWYEIDGKMCRFSNGEIVDIVEVPINVNN